MVRNGFQRHDGRWWDTEYVLGLLATYYGINKTKYSQTWKVRALVKHYWCKHPDYIWSESWQVAIKKNQVLVFEKTKELPSNVMTLMCPLIRSAEVAAEIVNHQVSRLSTAVPPWWHPGVQTPQPFSASHLPRMRKNGSG